MADAVIDLDAMRDRGVTVDGAKKWVHRRFPGT